jgi:hypothetical protein
MTHSRVIYSKINFLAKMDLKLTIGQHLVRFQDLIVVAQIESEYELFTAAVTGISKD